MSDRDNITLPRELVLHLKWVLEKVLLHGDCTERSAIEALRTHLAAPKQEPVAWQYKGEPSFDGNRWHDNYQVTTSKQVAKFKDKNAQPLYTALAAPRPVAVLPEAITCGMPFAIKHYTADLRPTIKGNGFDGLEIGESREEAEEFVAWVNARIAAPPAAAPDEAAIDAAMQEDKT